MEGPHRLCDLLHRKRQPSHSYSRKKLVIKRCRQHLMEDMRFPANLIFQRQPYHQLNLTNTLLESITVTDEEASLIKLGLQHVTLGYILQLRSALRKNWEQLSTFLPLLICGQVQQGCVLIQVIQYTLSTKNGIYRADVCRPNSYHRIIQEPVQLKLWKAVLSFWDLDAANQVCLTTDSGSNVISATRQLG